MKKIFTLFLVLAASVGTMVAQKVQIGDLYYYLDASNLTAEVICQLHGSKNNYSGLTTATIPATITYNAQEYSVTSIGGLAFYKCSSLTSVEIPNSVTSIVDHAFDGCNLLSSIICEALVPPTISSNTFSNKSCILFVPEESIMIYQNAVFWEEFDDIRAIGRKFEVTFVDWDDTVLKI